MLTADSPIHFDEVFEEVQEMRAVVRFVLCLTTAVVLAFPGQGMSEFRGLYVDAFHPGFKNHNEVTEMVNSARSANFNALIVQVRKRGDAYYNSSIEPRAADIAPDYDPLADIIREAHAAGLEVHAWLAVYEVSHQVYSPAPTHIARAHPEWLMSDREGKTTLAGGRVYVDPGVPAVQDHFVSLVTEILKKYDVDGIHLDNIRYPSATAGYNSISISRFNQKFNRFGVPEDNDEIWCQWRREQITDLLRKVRNVISTTKPEVKLSASVCSESPDIAKKVFLQEWDVWTRDNLLDFVVPMLYITFDRMPAFASQALAWAYARHVYIGVGAYRLAPQLACKHIEDARAAGAKGVVLFSYHYLGPNSKGANNAKMADLVASVFAEPASIPAMPSKE